MNESINDFFLITIIESKSINQIFVEDTEPKTKKGERERRGGDRDFFLRTHAKKISDFSFGRVGQSVDSTKTPNTGMNECIG